MINADFKRLGRIVRFGLAMFLAYALLRLALVIGVPAYVLQREWLLGIRMRCQENQSICVDVHMERNVVGGWWYGYGIYFIAKKGHADQLRQIITRDAPRASDASWLSPWRYIGIRVDEGSE